VAAAEGVCKNREKVLAKNREETTARELSPFHVGFGKMLYKEIL